jgi:GDPmannose 4,6-dehydratase
MARVLITGASGQVGSYLAELLLSEGHGVVGLASTPERPLPAGVERAQGSLLPEGIDGLLGDNGPLTALVHLASFTSMVESWSDPLRTFDLNGRAGVALAFGLARHEGLRLVHASSAEIFGRAASPVQREDTPLAPVSPYGIAKVAAHSAVRFVRDTQHAPASNLILYPTESPRRRPNFALRKIVRTVAAIGRGEAEFLTLGNADAVRDFSHARDVASAAKLLALGATPGDYICASGRGRSIREAAETAFRIAGVDPTGRIRIDPALLRPNDIPSLVGDNRALRSLGWEPAIPFDQLVRELLDLEAEPASLRS